MTIPRICILMGTYNGEKYLQEQLDSFCVQTHTNWILHVSDDGSQDNTLTILKNFQAKMGRDRVLIYDGPKKGFAANFLSLLCREDIQGDYYAFSDQDDVWELNKLARSLSCIEKYDQPALYGARTILTDQNNNQIGFSPLWKRKPSFKNALVQSIASGNTMLFNRAAGNLLKKYSKDARVISHDWWAYLVISGCGGIVWYDPQPAVRYRQHANNIIGRNDTWHARCFRMKQVIMGRFQQWNEIHFVGLSPCYFEFTDENKKTFSFFASKKKYCALLMLKKAGLYRQSLLGNIGLIVAALFGKI